MANGIVVNRQDVYVTNERTVITIVGLQVCGVGTGLVDILLVYLRAILVVPGVRRLAIADGDGVVVLIGSMYAQTEAIDRVATECALV